jgi:hypothetical protein
MEDDLYQALSFLGHPVAWLAFDRDVGFPRIVLQRVGNVTGYTLKGRSPNETARVQVNISHTNYPELKELGTAVSKLLTSFRGGSVIRCKEVSRQDGSSSSGGKTIRRQMLDFQVRYRA